MEDFFDDLDEDLLNAQMESMKVDGEDPGNGSNVMSGAVNNNPEEEN